MPLLKTKALNELMFFKCREDNNSNSVQFLTSNVMWSLSSPAEGRDGQRVTSVHAAAEGRWRGQRCCPGGAVSPKTPWRLLPVARPLSGAGQLLGPGIQSGGRVPP